jgi:hypothetical protein
VRELRRESALEHARTLCPQRGKTGRFDGGPELLTLVASKPRDAAHADAIRENR